ncbi:MAG: tetratricopeptide repeat protein [Pseudomonadota bacterium]
MRGMKMVLAGAALAAMVSAPAQGRSLSGAYLAATQAEIQKNHAEAARYFARALGYDQNNPALLLRAMQALVAKGDVSAGSSIAGRLIGFQPENQFALLVLISDDMRKGQFTSALDRIETGANGLTPLLADLVRGWILLNTGEEDEAFEVFASLNQNPTLKLFGRYHGGLAKAQLGDFRGAAELLEDDEDGPVNLNRGSTLARVQVLSQLGRTDDAIGILETVLATGFGDRQFEGMLDQLKAGETLPFDMLNSPGDGVAEVLFDLASILGDDSQDVALIYARLAAYIDSDFVEALLLSAEILERQGQFELATETYASVPRSSPQFVDAEIGRADALSASGRVDEAIGVLKSVTRTNPDLLRPHYLLGEALRREERYPEAIAVFDTALDVAGEPMPQHWLLHYARAVSHERDGAWDLAESDFRAALDLNPDQPLVLNYLGYSLVEKRLKLDEALDMIERAVAQRPQDGYITDSLGWVYYQLGRFEDAISPMERAVELTPLDPIINDHLGDVYWAVGRQREAEFQWRRALSFEPEPKDETRILRKLDVGLDVVLAEEAAGEQLEAQNAGD